MIFSKISKEKITVGLIGREIQYFKYLGGHERMILKLILKKRDGGRRLD
jgi:hypothetical protein